jgi:hypothetical protein
MKAASSVDMPFLKAYCSGTNILLVYKCWFNLLYIAFSNILEKVGNNEMGL